MGELQWRTPVPHPGLLPKEPKDLHLYLVDLARWLSEQEREQVWDVEAILAFGGLGVAERMFGFEDYKTSYPAAPVDYTAVSAPTGAKKRIIMVVHAHIFGTPGELTLIKKKGALESAIASINTVDHNHEDIPGPITLDATDETLVVRIESGTTDVSWSGSYVDVD